jgi:hypothetical protein
MKSREKETTMLTSKRERQESTDSKKSRKTEVLISTKSRNLIETMKISLERMKLGTQKIEIKRGI